ncbi:MAG: group II intron reverse transcriptase/maturase, partial [Cyanobacteria bacterium J06553_1]
AYVEVRKKRGGGGVDHQSLEDFEKRLVPNLYCLWNRVCSGCYFPPPVLEVGIPKDNGKTRYLGIPTVGDRVVQQVIKTRLETRFEALFHPSSYGYRRGRSQHDALEAVRSNCRDHWWVVDMDISAFFDNVRHDLLNLALDRHVSEPWIRSLINRWLSAPVVKENGEVHTRQGSGTPQGGVISPLLANLFLHYVLDEWLEEQFPKAKFVRFADDVIIHCDYYPRIKLIRKRVAERLEECGLSINEAKTQVVFCKSEGRKSDWAKVSFDFLGYRFQPRVGQSHRQNRLITIFDCAISPKSEQKICSSLRATKFHLWHGADLQVIADLINPRLRGWITYYGKYTPSRLSRVMSEVNDRLTKWVCGKYKSFGKSYRKAQRYLRGLAIKLPTLFYHWEKGYARS